MTFAEPAWFDVPGDGFAHAVVIGLEVVPGNGRAHEPPGSQLCQRSRAAVAGAAGTQSRRRLDRSSRERNHLEEPARFGLERGESAQQHLLQGAPDAGAALLHQLAEEERVASRFPRDLRHASGIAAGKERERERELAGVLGRQGIDGHFPRATHRLEGADAFAAPGILPAMTGDEQERRRIRRAHQFRQQGRTVGVAPLQVVDPDHQRSPVCDAREQLLESAKRAASQLLGVRNLDGGSGRGRHRRGLPQHGEQAHQGMDVARQQHFSLVPQTPQSLRERIDHAVERLVGDGFAFVAAAGQHGCPRVRPNAAEEAIDQRRLAHARTTLDEDGHGRAFARSCLRGFQRLELGPPPKEDGCRPLRGHSGRDVGTSQPSQHFRTLRPLVGVPMDERGRKLGEILRNAVATQRRRLSPDLCGEDVVKHRAHAVPIAGRAQLRAGGLLR